MATKKTEPVKPSQRELVARATGCLAGTSNHIEALRQELLNIAGRCLLAKEFTDDIPRKYVTEKDRQFLDELKAYCEGRFGNLHDMRKRIEDILERLNTYTP